MSANPMRILLIGHGPTDGRAVRAALADDVRDGVFVVECAPRLVDGLARLRGNGIAAILLDLRLPDSEGLAAFDELRHAAPHVPILVIGSRPTKTSPRRPSNAARRTISTATASTKTRCRARSSGSSSDRRRKKRCSSNSSARTSH
jgi:CheY-like chemotaxis protein